MQYFPQQLSSKKGHHFYTSSPLESPMHPSYQTPRAHQKSKIPQNQQPQILIKQSKSNPYNNNDNYTPSSKATTTNYNNSSLRNSTSTSKSLRYTASSSHLFNKNHHHKQQNPQTAYLEKQLKKLQKQLEITQKQLNEEKQTKCNKKQLQAELTEAYRVIHFYEGKITEMEKVIKRYQTVVVDANESSSVQSSQQRSHRMKYQYQQQYKLREDLNFKEILEFFQKECIELKGELEKMNYENVVLGKQISKKESSLYKAERTLKEAQREKKQLNRRIKQQIEQDSLKKMNQNKQRDENLAGEEYPRKIKLGNHRLFYEGKLQKSQKKLGMRRQNNNSEGQNSSAYSSSTSLQQPPSPSNPTATTNIQSPFKKMRSKSKRLFTVTNAHIGQKLNPQKQEVSIEYPNSQKDQNPNTNIKDHNNRSVSSRNHSRSYNRQSPSVSGYRPKNDNPHLQQSIKQQLTAEFEQKIAKIKKQDSKVYGNFNSKINKIEKQLDFFKVENEKMSTQILGLIEENSQLKIENDELSHQIEKMKMIKGNSQNDESNYSEFEKLSISDDKQRQLEQKKNLPHKQQYSPLKQITKKISQYTKKQSQLNTKHNPNEHSKSILPQLQTYKNFYHIKPQTIRKLRYNLIREDITYEQLIDIICQNLLKNNQKGDRFGPSLQSQKLSIQTVHPLVEELENVPFQLQREEVGQFLAEFDEFMTKVINKKIDLQLESGISSNNTQKLTPNQDLSQKKRRQKQFQYLKEILKNNIAPYKNITIRRDANLISQISKIFINRVEQLKGQFCKYSNGFSVGSQKSNESEYAMVRFAKARELFIKRWQLNDQEIQFIFLKSCEETGRYDMFDFEKTSRFFVES